MKDIFEQLKRDRTLLDLIFYHDGEFTQLLPLTSKADAQGAADDSQSR